MRKIAAVLMVMALLLLNLSPMTVLAKPNGPERVEATDRRIRNAPEAALRPKPHVKHYTHDQE